ncbi:hypothetical protein CDL12_08276 [Handroanthus impetiginosus]|uniref:Myb/SANT-like domain-containing protein n=1 Tax=Handroanthus impetiginosus TaxID=429701 RepID=A0A2G9HND8_9LAMI|nr:hypothetical protein CDL12_08276 [Handroanthus impetiginosus]
MEHSACSSRSNGTSRRPQRNPEKGPRRFWTPQEELELINALKSLRASGWKCDGSFRGGYMVRLERTMAEKFPTSGILAKHIKSKLQVWKKNYALILGILGSSGGAGASIDPSNHMIVADSESVWTEYIKVNPGASKLRGRPFQFYSSWVEIFGNDRAQGNGAIDVGDALTDLLYGTQTNETEISGENIFSPHTSTPIRSPRETCRDDISISRSEEATNLQHSTSSSKKRRRGPSSDDIESLVGKWMQDTSYAIGDLIQQIRPPTVPTPTPPPEPSVSQSRKALYDAVDEIPGLSVQERVLATHRLVEEDKYMDAFWGMCAEGRLHYVRLLLGDGSMN